MKFFKALIYLLIIFLQFVNNEEIDVEEIVSKLGRINNKHFKGKWKNNNENQVKTLLTNQFDKDYGDFYLDVSFRKNGYNNWILVMGFSLLEGEYRENWLKINLFYYFKNYYQHNHSDLYVNETNENDKHFFVLSNKYTNHTHLKMYHLFQRDTITHFDMDKIDFKFFSEKSNSIYNYDRVLGSFISSSIHFNISLYDSIEIKGPQSVSQSVFLIIVSLVGVLQIVVLYLVIHAKYRQGKLEFKNFSSNLIANDMCWNALICMNSISISFSTSENANGYATVAFLFFFIFGFFEGIIFYFSYDFESTKEMEKLLLNCFIHMILFILTITFLFKFKILIILLSLSTFLSQIIYNISLRDKQNGIPMKCIISFTINRLVIPLYIKGVKNNSFQSKTNYTFCVFLVLFHLIQITILHLQKKYGGKFLIPNRFKTNYFPYMQNVRSIAKHHLDFYNNQCAICLCPFVENIEILKNSLQTKNILKIIRDRLFYKQVYIMQTPCNHFFHINCLTSWVNMKKECPICRKKLPPIN